jgi:hypothetical protein
MWQQAHISSWADEESRFPGYSLRVLRFGVSIRQYEKISHLTSSNILGPQVFQSTDAPTYHHAFAAHIALYGAYDPAENAIIRIHLTSSAFFIVMAFVARIMLMRRNASRRAEFNSNGVSLS